MYPTATYPFFARLEEEYDHCHRGDILTIRNDLHRYIDDEVFSTQTSTGRLLGVPYASVTPLCQVCEEEPAISLGVYHPTTLLCNGCLEVEPGSEPEPQYCDHDHVAAEVRLLPTGGDSNMILCQAHHAAELAYRGTTVPVWDSLTPYEGA